MGGGIIQVISKDARPLPDHIVTIVWNWVGTAQGSQTGTTNNIGEAVFSGSPAFSEGKGTVKGPLGQIAYFTVGSNWVGEFPKTTVQVTWNPVESAAASARNVGSIVARGITQFAILLGVFALIGIAIYAVVKSLTPGKLIGFGRSLRSHLA